MRITLLCLILFGVGCFSSSIMAQGRLLGSAGDVEVWALPDDNPAEGVFAAIIVLSTTSDTTIAGLDSLFFGGRIHQVWRTDLPAPTVKGPPTAGANYAPQWIPFDSHLLITDENHPSGIDMIANSELGYRNLTESNDGMDGATGLPESSASVAPLTGFGAITVGSPNDSIDFEPEFQTGAISLARLVSPEIAPGRSGDITMTLGVFGTGIGGPASPDRVFFDALPVILTVPEPTCALTMPAFLLIFVVRRWL